MPLHKLDREFQLRLMRALLDTYPDARFDFDEAKRDEFSDADLVANLAYLAEHGLVSGNFSRPLSGEMRLNGSVSLTCRGVDFLADDGGLAAILGVVTVKLHADTIKELIAGRIAESDLPLPEKQTLISRVQKMGGEALQTVTNKLVEKGLDSYGSTLAGWIGSFLPGS